MRFELYKNHTKSNRLKNGFVFRACFTVLAVLLPLTAPATQIVNGLDPITGPGCDLPGAPESLFRQATDLLGEHHSHSELWSDIGQLQGLYRELDRLRIDGLQPQNYYLKEIGQLEARLKEGGTIAECEAALVSYSLIRSLGELKYGRVNPAELGLFWQHRAAAPEPRELASLAADSMASNDGIRGAYQKARPALDLYRQLRHAHREARRLYPVSWPEVEPGPMLRPGQSSTRIPGLVSRLAAQGYVQDDINTTDPHLYNPDIEQGVRAFQRDHGLRSDGLVGSATTEALNAPPAAWLAKIRANLERLRWLNQELDNEALLVDIAGAWVEYRNNGEILWSGKAQVGRPERKTPELSSSITHVTLNPTWTIPPTVFYQDTLPAIQRDPDYLGSHRIRVLDREGTELDPEIVDWSRPGGLILRQDAGEGNALGRVAIRFPNPFSVYLHDTPSVRLFDTPNRFYSSGCVRVENAMDLTRALFQRADNKRKSEFDSVLQSGRTRNLSLPAPVPVVMAYWTARGDAEGRIRFREDMYAEDILLIDLLEDAER